MARKYKSSQVKLRVFTDCIVIMVYCSVACCTNGNHNRQDLSYFVFPFDKRLKNWLKFCRRADKKFAVEARKAKSGMPNSLRICSAHFVPETFKRTLNGRRKILVSALPTIFKVKKEKSSRTVRYESITKKRRLNNDTIVAEPKLCAHTRRENYPVNEVESVVASSAANVQDIQHDHSYLLRAENDGIDRASVSEPADKVRSVSCQTDITIGQLEELEEQIKNFKNKLSAKAKLKRKLFLEDVLKNDDSVKFYIGLPSLGCFDMLVNFITPEAQKLKYWDKNKNKQMKYQTSSIAKPGPKRSLTVTEELVLCLVRLRLGLMGRHLADVFSVSQAQVSRIFTTWVCFLATVFKETLVLWPSKDEIKENLPHCFTQYPNTRIVIDCTEVFIDKPTSPFAQRATWSEYKEHNTIKALVGITPSGYFSFLSKFWTGSTSDRKITQESQLIDLLEEGDSVMADRGFNIRDMLTKKKVYLNIPPFSKKGKNNFSCIHATDTIRTMNFHIFLNNI